MTRPPDLDSDRGRDIWDAISAASNGDVPALRRLLARDPSLARSEQDYPPPIHFAVREGCEEAVRLLIDATAWSGAHDGLIEMARDRGHHAIAVILESARERSGRVAPSDTHEDHPIHAAAEADDVDRVRALLDADPSLVHLGDRAGGTPLHRAAIGSAHRTIALLLDRGADPNWPERDAPRGAALHAAARAGDRALVDLLLAHGADPNGHVNASGTATYAAKTPELRALLFAHGGVLDPYDLVWLGEDEEVMRRVIADPASANAGCGGVFTAVCTLGRRDLLVRLLDAGIRVPAVVNGCRSYLLHNPDMLRLLLASGMNPDLPTWQRSTLLHALCDRDSRGRTLDHRTKCAAMLLDAGAAISQKDDEYRSTPLAWAARNDLPDMIAFLLARGAPTNLGDDEPWATPLAWATRRRHAEIVTLLRAAGATA